MLSTDKGAKTKALSAKAREIKLLLLDVDGVLTDGRITYADRGEEIKSFHVRDGLGIKLLQGCGIEVAILTSRISEALLHRCRELKIETVLQGMEPKLAAYEWLLHNKGLVDSQVAYLGDDWVDIQILKRAGLPVAVKNADKGVMAYVDYVTQRDGGQGAVREVCELILEAKGLKKKVMATFT